MAYCVYTKKVSKSFSKKVNTFTVSWSYTTHQYFTIKWEINFQPTRKYFWNCHHDWKHCNLRQRRGGRLCILNKGLIGFKVVILQRPKSIDQWIEKCNVTCCSWRVGRRTAFWHLGWPLLMSPGWASRIPRPKGQGRDPFVTSWSYSTLASMLWCFSNHGLGLKVGKISWPLITGLHLTPFFGLFPHFDFCLS